MEFTDLKGLVRYEKGNLHLDSVTARMYGGDVAISGLVGLASPEPDFRVKVAVKDLAAEEILSRKTSLKDFLSGPVALSLDLGGGMRDFVLTSYSIHYTKLYEATAETPARRALRRALRIASGERSLPSIRAAAAGDIFSLAS